MSQNETKMVLHGAEELEKIMLALGPAISKKAAVKGVRRAATIMRNSMKAASPIRTGTLKREWSYKKLRAPRHSESVRYVVRIRNRHYYELLEFEGVEPGKRKRSGQGARQYAPKRAGRYNPFAERAMNNARSRVVAVLMSASKTALAEESGIAYAKSKRLAGRR